MWVQFFVWSNNRCVSVPTSTNFDLSGTCQLWNPLSPIVNCSTATVDHLLTILMITFESSAAILTIIRSIQAFKAGHSSWKLWKKGLSYMIFEEGMNLSFDNGGSILILNTVNVGILYFWWFSLSFFLHQHLVHTSPKASYLPSRLPLLFSFTWVTVQHLCMLFTQDCHISIPQ